jgi:transcriptional regulator with XRE-family HTH domain
MTPIRLRVQELREALGWSQRELGRRSGVRHATISEAEAGASVSLATLEKLANALDVNAAALIIHDRGPRGKS